MRENFVYLISPGKSLIEENQQYTNAITITNNHTLINIWPSYAFFKNCISKGGWKNVAHFHPEHKGSHKTGEEKIYPHMHFKQLHNTFISPENLHDLFSLTLTCWQKSNTSTIAKFFNSPRVQPLLSINTIDDIVSRYHQYIDLYQHNFSHKNPFVVIDRELSVTINQFTSPFIEHLYCTAKYQHLIDYIECMEKNTLSTHNVAFSATFNKYYFPVIAVVFLITIVLGTINYGLKYIEKIEKAEKSKSHTY